MILTGVKGYALRTNLLFMVLIMLFSACTEEKTIEAPVDLIPEDKFVELLVDMNIIEATRSMHMSNDKKSRVATEAFYNALWDRTSISEERFRSSFDFYRKDPAKMAEFYSKAAELIKRKEDQINEKKRSAGAIQELEPSE